MMSRSLMISRKMKLPVTLRCSLPWQMIRFRASSTTITAPSSCSIGQVWFPRNVSTFVRKPLCVDERRQKMAIKPAVSGLCCRYCSHDGSPPPRTKARSEKDSSDDDADDDKEEQEEEEDYDHELEADIIQLVEDLHEESWLAGPLKIALDKRKELGGRDLKKDEIPHETLDELHDLIFYGNYFMACHFEGEEGELNIDFLNRVLEELEDKPFCDTCRAFHETESRASCFGIYFGPGGFVGHYGDGIMPTLDPTHKEYRRWDWDDS